MTKEETFECAIIDAINIYIRTVLVPKGYISLEKYESIGSGELLQLKYAIAKELASEWAKIEVN
jgi:hypothetical protein